jgi:tripartite ATP-independent transporter DctM subunit
VWGILLLFTVVLGGIYFGAFTPTEAAGIGAAGAFLFALLRRKLTRRILFETLLEAGQTTLALFAVIFGAVIFAKFINIAGLTSGLLVWVEGMNLSVTATILLIVGIYLVLGCVLDSVGMIVLTVPIFAPLVQSLGLDLVWFGVIVVVVTEIGLITPPIGMNLFVIRSIAPEVPLASIVRGVMPFWSADITRLAVFIFVPWTALFLPSFMR